MTTRKGPSDWFIKQRAYPYNKVDYTAYRNAIQAKRIMQSSVSLRDYLEWELAGPTNIGGRVQDIEMDPANMDVIYVGSASGGIFKSDDAGATWESIFDQLESFSIGDIAVSSSDPDIIYAGTGEPNCGGGSVTYDGAGIFKSVDAGSTWNYSGLDSTRNTGRIVIDPKNNDRVFAATMGDLFADGNDRGVYRTTDGGQTWQQVLFVSDSTGAIDLAINPDHPDTLYACMWERVRRFTYEHYGGVTCGIYRSHDGGDTWQHLANDLPSSNIGRIGIDISKSNPNVLYSIYADESGDFKGVYKTSDGGDTWQQTNDGSLSNIFSSYGWWFGRIKIDPVNNSIVYAMGLESYKTSNGGNSWSNFSGSMHVDHHSLFIHPLDNQLLSMGNDGGIYRSSNAGNSWTQLNGLPNNQFYTSEIDFNSPEKLYGGLQDNGVVRTETGNTNDWDEIVGGDGFYILVDPADPDYLYGESQYGGLQRSTDGGNNWSGATNGIPFSARKNWNTPIAFNPQNPKTLYYGANKLYKSLNRAQSWSVISNDLSNGYVNSNVTYATITTISVSPLDSNIIICGTDDGNVWVTENNGVIWTKVSDDLPDRWVTRVVCDQFNSNVVYVTLSGYRFNDNMSHVYKTDNLGQSWQSISGNLPDIPCNDLIIDPALDSILYLATDAGVFYSSNLGGEWFVLGFNLPPAPVTDLTFHPVSRKLIAATYGRSMHTIDLSLFTAVYLPEESEFRVSVFPSIIHDEFQVKIFGSENGSAEFSLINETGRELWISTETFTNGKNIFTFLLPSEVSSGVYFLQTIVNGTLITNKIIVVN